MVFLYGAGIIELCEDFMTRTTEQSIQYRGNSTVKSSGYRKGLEPATFRTTHAEEDALID